MYLNKRIVICAMALTLAINNAIPAFAIATESTSFNAAQQTDIGKIAEEYFTAHPDKMGEAVATYLAEHPEFLVAAGENLRQRQQIQQQQAQVQAALHYQSELLTNASPSVGPDDAKAAVVMFFDYQCSSCRTVADSITQLQKSNPDVRFVFKELPILSSRWPVSGLAAMTGEKIWLTQGGNAYLAYHNAVYATDKNEGKLQENDVQKAAKNYLTAKQFAALKQPNKQEPALIAIQANETLANKLGINDSPVFVVMPQAIPADPQRIYVATGSASLANIQMAIQKAKG